MPIDLAAALPLLLPKAVAWAESESAKALASGIPLSTLGTSLAQSVGVRNADNIRLVVAEHLPMPSDTVLRDAAIQTGLLGPDMVGLTLGHAVFVRTGHEASRRLLSHEFRHVYQYETAGSIAAFLPTYLNQIVAHGYFAAPLEVDARAHERDGP
jgi:hypothetical protein